MVDDEDFVILLLSVLCILFLFLFFGIVSYERDDFDKECYNKLMEKVCQEQGYTVSLEEKTYNNYVFCVVSPRSPDYEILLLYENETDLCVTKKGIL